ncbi:MAG TPA: alpha/beta hydrolase [Polyangiaceae bacterium]|jgi:pimeloyl-ACP methyl ester carboxylesterase|nr:alpha/beta hydrolase [Polyangiaceae bacterium]
MTSSLVLVPIIDGAEHDETIVFLQGWPDSAAVWDEAATALARRYRCVRVTLPNFGGDRTTRWGYSTTEIVDALVELLRDVGKGQPVSLVLHDWGSYWGHAAHHRSPELVARVASLDVAPHFKPTTAKGALGIVAYQGWLLAAFAVGGPPGTWMTRRFARLGRFPVDEGRLDCWMNYPYRNVWADLLTGRARELTKGYWPTCPLLFVYGQRKPFPFHSASWTDHVRRVGGEVIGLPCGHWVMRDPSFVGILSAWLARSRPLLPRVTDPSPRTPRA